MRTHAAIQLEVASRRACDFRNAASDGPFLSICGANWQLASRATVARPKFVDGKPTFEEQEDKFPAADAMIALTPENDIATCPTCGAEKTRFDAMNEPQWLLAAAEAAAEALSAKYDLSDEQLADLLVLDAESARWLVQLNQWANCEPTDRPPVLVASWADCGDAESFYGDDAPEPDWMPGD